ncbi:MAG TPA: M56 family metallopeptidase [Gemmatimonadales bacterium]|nr:M56 family metallopeptidase [Gemmatimonadales bacterium]
MSAIWIVSMLVKGTLLLVAAIVVAAALRRASAAVRHLVWGTVIASLLVLPLVSAVLPWQWSVVPLPIAAAPGATLNAGVPTPPSLAPAPSESPRAPGASAVGSGEKQAPATVPPAAPSMWSRLTPPTLLASLLLVWALGAAYLLGRLILGAVVLARVVRRGTPLDAPEWRRPLLEAADRLALERLPRLVMSDRLPMPFACGVLHPAIVLPVEAAEWDDRRRRTVLFHELAHLTRYDLVANALGQVAAAVYWFHPLVWTAVRKLRIESERACDDLVLGVGTRASEYADHLLQIVCRAARSRTPAVALPMAQRHEFEGRMLAILERVARREPASWRHGALLAALALALILPLAALAPTRPAVTSAGPVDVPPAVVPQTDTGTPRERRLVDSRSTTATTRQTVTRTETVTSTPTLQGGDTAAVVAALTRALGDSVASVREDAAYALGQLEAGAAVEPLAARLLKDPVPKVREMCAWALAQIGNRGAVTTLSSSALKDSSASVRGMAVWALGQLEDPGSVEPLSAVLRDASAEVRGRAAWALGSIGPERAPPALIAALRDPSNDVRLRSAWALGQIADSSAVPQLAATLRDSTSEVRRAALWALGQIGGDAAQGALLQALEDRDPEVRARAARALAGNHGDPWPWPWPMPIIR